MKDARCQKLPWFGGQRSHVAQSNHDFISIRQLFPWAFSSSTPMCQVFLLSHYNRQILSLSAKSGPAKNRLATNRGWLACPEVVHMMENPAMMYVNTSLLCFFPQHPVLDRLEQRGSEDRELHGGRSEPQGGGFWRHWFAKRSYIRLFFRTVVLGRCRYTPHPLLLLQSVWSVIKQNKQLINLFWW